MHSFPCIFILWCATSTPGFTDTRSINIVFSHEYKFAVDDYKEQDVVNLDALAANVRQELEKSIKLSQKKNQIVKFKIPQNATLEQHPKATEGTRESEIHLVDLLVAGTTQNVRPFIDTPYPPLEDELHERQKRNANLAQLANKNIGGSPMHHVAKTNGMTEFEVISEEDMIRAKKQRLKGILMYIGITLLAVLGFSIIAFCFMTDPKSCIIAFGTGSPCCLIICPCILHCVKKFLTPGEMVRDNTNKYIPGMMVHPDGKLETYDPTPEEIEAVMDIIDIIQNM